MSDVLDELQWRGLVAQSTDEAALRSALSEGTVDYYVGFDPTAPSLHIGNLVQILTARRLQDAGRVAAAAHAAVDLLGAERLLFGSDWPMSARVAPYGEIVGRTARALPRLDDAAVSALWSGTAARLYGITG